MNKNLDKRSPDPVASEDTNKTNQIPTTSYNNNYDMIIPVTIAKDKHNQYMFLENDLNEPEPVPESEINPYDNLIIEKPMKKVKPRMDLSTQFYVGSLTVIGLFVFYRLIQKTR
jgi:hypothetical protein